MNPTNDNAPPVLEGRWMKKSKVASQARLQLQVSNSQPKKSSNNPHSSSYLALRPWAESYSGVRAGKLAGNQGGTPYREKLTIKRPGGMALCLPLQQLSQNRCRDMECKCGGSTKEHKLKHSRYIRCIACGRVEWLKRPVVRIGDGYVITESTENILALASEAELRGETN